MFGCIVVGSFTSDPFEVKVIVKHGCVFAPTLFNIYLATTSLLSWYNLHLEDGIALPSAFSFFGG